MTKIFLTGITGLVGSAFACALVRERDDVEIITLARGNAVAGARERVEDIIREQCEFDGYSASSEKVLRALTIIESDVTKLDPAALATRPEMKNVSKIFHCAAVVHLGKDPEGIVLETNLGGTKKVLELAKLLGVQEFHYVGTAYVAGKLSGIAHEDKPVNSGFNNAYEESKFLAEMEVRNSGVPFSIYRPSIIIGRLQDGRIRKPLAFYRIIEFVAKLKKHRCAKLGVDPLTPIDLQVHFDAEPSELVYFVPIDFVQTAITRLFQKPVANKSYHITGNSPVSTLMIAETISKILKIKNITVGLLDDELNMDEKLMTRFLGDLLPYFSSNIIFDQTNIRSQLGNDALNWKVGREGLEVMIKSFFLDFFPSVQWVQEVVAD